MSSAIRFNFGPVKILSSGNGLIEKMNLEDSSMKPLCF